jgi:hypothetical protein
MRKWRRFLLGVSGVLAGSLLLGVSAYAASSANISRAYQADGDIPNGSLVSLKQENNETVTAANSTNGSRLVGVAVSSNDSILAVDPTSGTVQVATNGTATALVSDVNGDIKVGDQISVSPFNGLGMKAAPGSRIIGIAQTAFSASTQGATEQQVQDRSGKQQAVHVGFLRINIGVGTSSSDDGAENLNALQRLVRSLTGRTISTLRIVIALIVTVIAVAALIALVYASIFGSIISVGRNPLAKQAIFRTLGGVIIMACVMAVVAAGAVFFLLR